MKKINKEQESAILNLLQKYNVGVQEYSAVLKMFQDLPVVVEENQEEAK
jgi:hypothetical protein